MKSLVRALSTLFLLGLPFLAQAAARVEPLRVTVSIPPQRYFVQQIGGGLVEVSVMAAPGANPHVFEPRPQQMVALSKSRIYFAIGVTFERAWLKKFAGVNPEMMIVPTDEGIEKLPMAQDHPESEKGHDHGNKDPHVWLSPPLVMIQARNVLDALVRMDPSRRTRYEENYRVFMRDLVDLDLKIRAVFSGKERGLKFMVYHPSWGYFAKSYGLKQIPIEMEGKEPRPRQLEELIQRGRKEGVKVVFVQPQFSSKSANTIAQALKGQVMYADPLASNWAENLLEVAEKFREALR
ncbi:MAG: zinc ABC transporter substrate-binding protein [Proteobacteria bacterium]|nr:zinc ABC transporter substrate-binding protein [Pseudomonadota bacterium]